MCGPLLCSWVAAGAMGDGRSKRNRSNLKRTENRAHIPTGCLKAVWPEFPGSVFGRFSAKLGPKTHLDRRGSSCSAGCTKNDPGRPILRPFRGAKKFRPDCLQVPSLNLATNTTRYARTTRTTCSTPRPDNDSLPCPCPKDLVRPRLSEEAFPLTVS